MEEDHIEAFEEQKELSTFGNAIKAIQQIMKLSYTMQLSTACMLIDEIALKSGKKSSEVAKLICETVTDMENIAPWEGETKAGEENEKR